MDIDEKIKESYVHGKSIGRLIPLITSVSIKEQIRDVIKITEYKKILK